MLVSTYVVCERLSVMHEPAGVVEILVQILQFTPYSELGTEYPPPHPKWKLSESPNSRVVEYPPQWKLSEGPNPRVSEYPYSELGTEYPPPNENCQRVQIWEWQNTPPYEN